MARPRCVVCLSDVRDFLSDEVRVVMHQLRPAFGLTFVRSVPALEVEVERGARVAIIVSHIPLTTDLVKRTLAHSVSCLIFVAPGQPTEPKTTLQGAPSVHWLDPAGVPRSLAAVVTIGLIEDLLNRALVAVARSTLFAGFDGLQEALKRALASPTPPVEPVASVSKVARLAGCSRRWADLGWLRVCERSGRPHPSLKHFLAVILFLKGLRLWLMHEPLRTAPSISVSTRARSTIILFASPITDPPSWIRVTCRRR
jgi:hypothetical protein